MTHDHKINDTGTTNPIEAAHAYLVECGYDSKQANELITALHDSDKARLWSLAPKWIEHVGEHRRYMNLLECVATGVIEVTANPDGTWMFKLADAFVNSQAGRDFAKAHGLPA